VLCHPSNNVALLILPFLEIIFQYFYRTQLDFSGAPKWTIIEAINPYNKTLLQQFIDFQVFPGPVLIFQDFPGPGQTLLMFCNVNCLLDNALSLTESRNR